MTEVKERPEVMRQNGTVVNEVYYSFVKGWVNQIKFWQDLSFMRVPTPLESWSCENGRRPVLWDGKNLNLSGFTLYVVTHKFGVDEQTEEKGFTLEVTEQVGNKPVSDKQLHFQIRGIAKWPAYWLILSGLKWRLVVASNGFHSFVVSCEILKDD